MCKRELIKQRQWLQGLDRIEFSTPFGSLLLRLLTRVSVDPDGNNKPVDLHLILLPNRNLVF